MATYGYCRYTIHVEKKQSKQNSVCKYCNYIAYISMAFGVSHITAPSAASVSYRQWPGHKKEPWWHCVVVECCRMYHENQQRDQKDTCCNRFIICDLVFIYIYIVRIYIYCTYIYICIYIYTITYLSIYQYINISSKSSLVYKCCTHIHSVTGGFSGQTGVKRNNTLW